MLSKYNNKETFRIEEILAGLKPSEKIYPSARMFLKNNGKHVRKFPASNTSRKGQKNNTQGSKHSCVPNVSVNVLESLLLPDNQRTSNSARENLRESSGFWELSPILLNGVSPETYYVKSRDPVIGFLFCCGSIHLTY